MLKALLLLLFISVGLRVSAQDTLFLDNDRYVTGYVYKRIPSGFFYYEVHGSDTERRWIRSGRILQIAYQDGTFERRLKPVKMDWVRKISKPGKPPKPVGYSNAVTFNFPTYNNIGGYSGISVGAEATRIIDKSGRYSIALSYHRLWAGSVESNFRFPRQSRVNIQGSFVVPSAFYHPFGNKDYIDLGLGMAIPLGTISRQDVLFRQTFVEYTPRSAHFFTAILLQANATFQTRGHFLITGYASFGPMLEAGKTSGCFGQAGFKIGGRF